jgi:hypothetical protein
MNENHTESNVIKLKLKHVVMVNITIYITFTYKLGIS